MTEWLRTDEKKEPFETLKLANKLLREVEIDPYYWKWVLITIHMALQGTMVLALGGSTQLRVLSEGSARAVRSGVPGAERRLDSFMNLYRKAKREDAMSLFVDSRPLPATNEQDDAVKYLHDTLRNKFEHFLPGGWSIAIDDLPSVLLRCVSVIYFLAFESGNVFWAEGPTREEMHGVVTDLRDKLWAMMM